MAKDTHDEAAAADEMTAEGGKPASQVEAENPSEEAREQEARELRSRLPGAVPADGEADEMAATDEGQPAGEAPAEG